MNALSHNAPRKRLFGFSSPAESSRAPTQHSQEWVTHEYSHNDQPIKWIAVHPLIFGHMEFKQAVHKLRCDKFKNVIKVCWCFSLSTIGPKARFSLFLRSTDLRLCPKKLVKLCKWAKAPMSDTFPLLLWCLLWVHKHLSAQTHKIWGWK